MQHLPVRTSCSPGTCHPYHGVTTKYISSLFRACSLTFFQEQRGISLCPTVMRCLAQISVPGNAWEFMLSCANESCRRCSGKELEQGTCSCHSISKWYCLICNTQGKAISQKVSKKIAKTVRTLKKSLCNWLSKLLELSHDWDVNLKKTRQRMTSPGKEHPLSLT